MKTEEDLINEIAELKIKLFKVNEKISKAIETFEKEIRDLKEKRRMIMTILTPENGYLKVDIEFEIKRLEKYLEILKGGNND